MAERGLCRMAAWVVGVGVLLTSVGGAPAQEANLKTYQTRYYVIHSDLETDTVREAAARLTAMAEEYHRRTKGFPGQIRERLPFYLVSTAEAYLEVGGRPGTAGLYTGNRLVALAAKQRGDGVWKTVQHEGFHQFSHTVISSRLPVWVDEGLADYFGHAIWTGDGYVTGIIPPERLRRVKARIAAKQIRSFLEMIMMDREEWNRDIQSANYDQAWSMVHFLVHADGEKYQNAFAQFLNDVAGRRPWKLAFERRFGRDVGAFQQRYGQWWSSQDEDPTRDKRISAVVQTLTSFLARAFAQRQKFDDTESFFQAGRCGRLQMAPKQWLPPQLLEGALSDAAGLGAWSLNTERSRPRLSLARPDGTTFVGTFALQAAQVSEVGVDIASPPAGPATDQSADKLPPQ